MLVAAQHDNVRRDAEALQLLHGVLRGLALVLAAGLEVGHERDVDEERVPLPLLERDLAYGLQEGLALYVADGAAYLGYDDVGGGLLAQGVDELLYLVRHMGDYLHCRAQILAAPLLIEDVPVHAARGEVREAVQILVYEALVVPEVEVGPRPRPR